MSTDTVINVADSKIGWAKSFRELVSLLYSGQIPEWDVSEYDLQVPRSRLSAVVQVVLNLSSISSSFTVELFQGAAGRKLSSIECHDLCCKIASCRRCRRSQTISASSASQPYRRPTATVQARTVVGR